MTERESFSVHPQNNCLKSKKKWLKYRTLRKLVYQIIMVTDGHSKINTIKINNAHVRIIASFEGV